MAAEHLKTDDGYKTRGLDLEILKIKLFNWLAGEVAAGTDIGKTFAVPDGTNPDGTPKIVDSGITIKQKMEQKADGLAEIIDGYVKNAVVYVDVTESTEDYDVENQEYKVTADDEADISDPQMRINFEQTDGNIEITDSSQEGKYFNLRIK